MKYRVKQAVTVEALQFIDNPERISQLIDFIGTDMSVDYLMEDGPILRVGLNSHCSPARIKIGGWVVRGLDGNLYHYTKEVFDNLYEPVSKPEPEIILS